jgi:hypothetical protein
MPVTPSIRPLVALVWAVLVCVGCRGEPATAADCRAIHDRIVALELAEQGYRDPALTARKQEAFARRFAAELARCEGVPLPRGARECVARATSSEQISHECLH